MLVLPVLLILSAIAINLAYLQLSKSDLTGTNDLFSKAGGRALSAKQSVDAVHDLAISTSALNRVTGKPLRLHGSGSSNQIEFGVSTRPTNSEYSKFWFTELHSTSTGRMKAVTDVGILIPAVSKRNKDGNPTSHNFSYARG
jgi:hypothetical protein